MPGREIQFDDGYENSAIEGSISMFFEEEPVDINFVILDNSSFIVRTKNTIKDNKEYKLKIDLSKFVDTKNNKTDSVYTVVLKTKNKLDYSGVSGKVNNVPGSNIIVNLNSP